ncbi:NADH dehydrogenase (quinone) [Solidesulfovibrio carbinoliphilus subsp. oakridgensis]|uniref:NADH dehydrogenase (Quinone) n=1 Tax=Solidesulfovibrio carbinoliphilus subsp. oakridgensis TaxID=694327 RepID=G7QBT9_9BACT|nr:Na(+)/H(+) antiporter subunit D [Solidesulfovibrio carbinoliphilus]EHJ49432.1 NADH dehydrogenase (quinone) [Solidesulfovibrio carbinoliphilus subsp. oakridgensis]
MAGLEQIAGIHFLHPSIGFLALALVMAFLKNEHYMAWRWLLLAPPVVAIASVAALTMGPDGARDLATLHYLGQTLQLGRVDALALVFASVFSIQALIGFIYALHVEDRGQHMAACLYVAGGFGCVFAGDYITLFIFWEIMSIGSVFLIWLRGTEQATAAGFRYFLFHIFGGLFLLAGLLLRYGAIGTFAFTAVAPDAARYFDYIILIGFLVNAAFVPLHAWLPDAYPEATITGAVFMSAFTTKTAVYVLARGYAGFEVLAIGGCVMCLYGVFYATIENNARRILSYHIVSQVGYMVCGIGIGTAMTVDGACAHAYAHILYKGLLFMGAGCLLYSAGTAKLTELGGLASRLPLVMIGYMVGAVSISGMPLFNGFVSKTMTIAGAAEAHRTWLALGMELAAVGTFLSVGIKLPYFAFWAKPKSEVELKPIPWNMYLGMGISSILCLGIGLFPQTLYSLLPFPTDYVPYTPWHVLQSCLILGFTGLGFYLMRKIIPPHPSRNLDFDFLYRWIGRGFVKVVSVPAAAIDNVWTDVYEKVGLRGLIVAAFGTNVFDGKVIDGVLDGSARGVREVGGAAMARSQTGRLQDYLAAAVAVGLLIFAAVWYLG